MNAAANGEAAGALPGGALVSAPRTVVVRLGGEILALAAEAGGRIVEIESCTPVPTGPGHLIGLGNAQGVILAVVDARRVLGLSESPWKWPILAKIVGNEELRLALAIDEVLGLEALDAGRIDPPGRELAETLRPFCLGSFESSAGRALVLDVARVIEKLQEERSAGISPPLKRRPAAWSKV